MLKFKTKGLLRLKIVLSIVSNKPFAIEKCFLTARERHFLNFVSTVTESKIKIDKEKLFFTPGSIKRTSVYEAGDIELSYFIEAFVVALPFVKTHSRIVLKGTTNSATTVDSLQLSLASKIVGASIVVVRRGFAPSKDGEVVLEGTPQSKLQFSSIGLLNSKVDGLCVSSRLQGSLVRDFVMQLKGKLCDRVYIATDAASIKESSETPGMSIILCSGCALTEGSMRENETIEEFSERIAADWKLQEPGTKNGQMQWFYLLVCYFVTGSAVVETPGNATIHVAQLLTRFFNASVKQEQELAIEGDVPTNFYVQKLDSI